MEKNQIKIMEKCADCCWQSVDGLFIISVYEMLADVNIDNVRI